MFTEDLTAFLSTDDFAETVTRSNATTFPAIFFDARGLDYGFLITGNKPTLEADLARFPVTSPTWATAYPALARMTAATRMAPEGNVIADNVLVDCPSKIQLQGPSAPVYMKDAIGTQVTTGRKWSGRPTREWLTAAGPSQTYFPWVEFDLGTDEAMRARALT